ncbi:MAG: hypothetical protein ACR2MB_11695 [Acidimicrobiales bacterium]
MDIEVMHTSGCPNVADLIDHLASRTDLTVTVTLVTAEGPIPVKFSGSPTVLVDGENPFGGERSDAPSCALHPPTIEQIDRHLGRASASEMTEIGRPVLAQPPTQPERGTRTIDHESSDPSWS